MDFKFIVLQDKVICCCRMKFALDALASKLLARMISTFAVLLEDTAA